MTLLRTVVRMSACCSADGTYSTLIFHVLNKSRMKWKHMSMCLLLAELRGISALSARHCGPHSSYSIQLAIFNWHGRLLNAYGGTGK